MDVELSKLSVRLIAERDTSGAKMISQSLGWNLLPQTLHPNDGSWLISVWRNGNLLWKFISFMCVHSKLILMGIFLLYNFLAVSSWSSRDYLVSVFIFVLSGALVDIWIISLIHLLYVCTTRSRSVLPFHLLSLFSDFSLLSMLKYWKNGHLLDLNLPSDLRSRLRFRPAGAWKFICEWSMLVTDAIVLWLLSRNSPVSAHTAKSYKVESVGWAKTSPWEPVNIVKVEMSNDAIN